MGANNPFENIRFDDFRRLAKENNLSKYERIGFPDSYRAGFEGLIFEDIQTKLYELRGKNKYVIDIGPGCSDLPIMLLELCRANEHRLHFVDCQEMLAALPDDPVLTKTAALFPDCPNLIDSLHGKVDIVLCYSVLHYILVDTSFLRFIDSALSLLAPGGQMLLGDIPNVSKRKRFFSSEAGVQFHQEFMKTNEAPQVNFNTIEQNQIDDSIVLAILSRSRSQGYDAYVLPQRKDLPMANRREDILIIRP